jgi:hypothetical protein
MVITAASTSFEGPISRLIAILLGREGTVERERKGLANHSRSIIHSAVIVVKFDFAKGHERQVQIRAGLKRKISEQLNVTKILGGNDRLDAIQRITLDFKPACALVSYAPFQVESR